jgi:hypothetical protein
MKKRIGNLKTWYEEHERRISIGSLLTGFFVDALTLQRIDALRENLWMAGNIFVIAVAIILINRSQDDDDGFWLPNILQFSFGALLGSFFIFYFRSAAIATSWPFLSILFLAIVANEFFQKKYSRLAFQLSFFYFSLFSFSIFLMPLVVKKIGPDIFILSGGVSLFVLWLFIFALRKYASERFLEARTHIWSFVTVIFIGINILYFTGLIPPIPLALKDSGIYHAIDKSISGNYIVYKETKDWGDYLSFKDKIHWQDGQPLHAYSAIFSPGSLNADVVHDWQYQNGEGEWVTATRIPLYIAGGRSGGFRVYSTKYTFTPGPWRVDVKTPSGQLIGRVNFDVVLSENKPDLVTEIKD